MANCEDPPAHECHGVLLIPVKERRIDIMKYIAKFIGKASLSLKIVEDFF